MSQLSLEMQLDRIEQQFNAVSAALVQGDAGAIQLSSADLQQWTVQFSELASVRGVVLSDAMLMRMKSLAEGIPVLRQNLLRRAAFVDQALQLVLPQVAQSSTYAAPTSLYGNAMRQSGEFKVLKA